MTYWINKALWLAKQVLDSSDYKQLQQIIEQKKYTLEKNDNQIQLTIPTDIYVLFNLIITQQNDIIVTELYYYMN